MPKTPECSNNPRQREARQRKARRRIVGVVMAVGLVGFLIALATLHHHRRFHSAMQRVFHLKDGRFCYQQHNAANNDDTWFWLWAMNRNDYYRDRGPLRDRLPSDTAWVSSGGDSIAKVQAKPNPEEEEEIDQEASGKASGEQQEQVMENESDEPASVDEGGNGAAGEDSGGGSGGGDEGGGGGDNGGGGGGDD